MTLREELTPVIDEMAQLRDEIRVRLHLGGMDARDEWYRLEERVDAVELTVERAADDAAEATRGLVHELRRSLRSFRDRLVQIETRPL
ncbi:MAG: hypothetical protein IT376_09930 [Polyangiaceae bacterium]|nr:hypothetical protein [Polyangiaceae bacterium]